MDTSNINGGKIMLSSFRIKCLLCLLLYASGMSSQDKLPQKAARNLISRIPKPALKVKWPADTIPYTQLLPQSFRNVKSKWNCRFYRRIGACHETAARDEAGHGSRYIPNSSYR